jgi:hypothetical protein
MHYAVARGLPNRTLAGAIEVTAGRYVLLTRSLVPDACAPAPLLPAPLVAQLQALPVGNTVELSWTTRNECNVSNYLLERSANGQTWQSVATLAPTAPGATYRRIDTQPFPGLSYYRVQVVLSDGQGMPAAPVPVRSGASVARFSLYPNPSITSDIKIEYNATAAGDLVVYIYDALGRYHGGQRLRLAQSGLNIVPLSLNKLRPGWYALRWKTDDDTGTAPFVKLE